MPRPTFIIAEPEPVAALSARKLVLETAKFNVITGYSKAELMELIERFPGADAVVVHTDLIAKGIVAEIDDLKQSIDGKPLILVSPSMAEAAGEGDYLVDSHDPENLLRLLRHLFGDPRPSELTQT
jgi:hypothetical protein